MNQIRAGEAETPEQSRHTSAYDRIKGLEQQRAIVAGEEVSAGSKQADAWLCELTLQKDAELESDVSTPSVNCRASNKGLVSISLEKYLELLDWTGRQIRADKKGAIPATLAPILERLGIRAAKLVDVVQSFHGKFGLVVGSAEAVANAVRRAGRHWFRGAARCAEAFA